MIVMREEEIRQFKPKTYWTVSINVDGVKYNWEGQKNVTRFYDRQKLDAF